MCDLDPVTPGELLLGEFLKPMGISQYRLVKEIDVPPQRIGDIIAGKRSVTVDTDLCLCRFFGLSKGYWLRAQIAHDMEIAERALGAASAKIKPWAGIEMNTPHPDSKEDIICRCSGTTTGQIKRLIDKGIHGLDEISRATGACSGCGACDTDILALLAEYSSPVSRNAV